MADSKSSQDEMVRPSRGRAVAATICVVLAALLTVPAGIAFWGQRTLTDTQRYVDTIGPLVDSPEVQAVIATKVTDAIQQQVDVESIVNNVFGGVISDRPRLEALVGPMAGAVNGLIETQVREVIASDAFAAFWTTANTRAQVSLVLLLEGRDSGAVSLQGDQVVLDVSMVIDQVKERLVARGLTRLENVPIPDKDREIVLLETSELKNARAIYAFAQPLAKWLLPFVALLYLAAFILSRRKARMTVIIGALIAANALLLALALSIGGQLFVNQLEGTDLVPAATVVYDQLFSFLNRGQRVLLWLGVILVIVGWFTGRNRLGTAARTTLGDDLAKSGSRLAEGPAAGVGRWVAANARWLRYAVGAVGAVVLFWGNDVSESRLLWSVVLVAVLLIAVQVLAGVGRDPKQTVPESTALPASAGNGDDT